MGFSMDFNLQQLATPTDQSSLDKMIPVFIGISKTNVLTKPTFTDATYSIIQLPSNTANSIDQASIIPTITYWKEITSEVNLNNPSATNVITSTIATTTKFDENCLFVVYDLSHNLLFSSTIDSFTYSLTALTSFKLTNQFALIGNFTYKLISKVQSILSFTYDSFRNQVTPIFIGRSNIISFPTVVSKESTISYNYLSKSVTTKILSPITVNDVISEANPGIAKGLIVGQSAIVISIPSDAYINDAIDILKINGFGYYIVPVDLSAASVAALKSFVQNEFLSLVIPATLVSETRVSGTYHA